jgi:hypothetical protein
MIETRLGDLKQLLRTWRDAQFRFWAGAAFVMLAMVSIQYEEVIAPGVSRVGLALDGATADFRTKLSSFTL